MSTPYTQASPGYQAVMQGSMPYTPIFGGGAAPNVYTPRVDALGNMIFGENAPMINQMAASFGTVLGGPNALPIGPFSNTAGGTADLMSAMAFRSAAQSYTQHAPPINGMTYGQMQADQLARTLQLSGMDYNQASAQAQTFLPALKGMAQINPAMADMLMPHLNTPNHVATYLAGQGASGLLGPASTAVGANLTSLVAARTSQELMGFTNSQYMGLAASMQARGLTANLYEGISARDYLGMSGPAAEAMAARQEQSIRGAVDGLLPSINAAMRAFKLDDPEMGLRALDSITGGGLGQLDPGEIEQRMSRFQALMKATRVSAEAMSAFVQDSVRLANSMGMDTTVAAENAMTALASGYSTAQSISGMLTTGDTVTNIIGLDRSAHSMARTISRQSLSAQGSQRAGDVAAAIRLLDGRDLSELDLSGRNAEVAAQLHRLQNGLSYNDDVLTSTGLQNLVSAVTGTDRSVVAGLFGNNEFRQNALARNPELVDIIRSSGQPQEAYRSQLRSNSVNRITGLGLNRESQLAVLLATKAADGDRTALEKMLRAQSILNDEDIAGIMGLDEGEFNALLKTSIDTRLTQEDAASYLTATSARDFNERLNTYGGYAMELSKSLSGATGYSQFISQLAGVFNPEDGNFPSLKQIGEALAGGTRSGLLRDLSNTDFIKQLSTMDLESEQGILYSNFLASLLRKTPEDLIAELGEAGEGRTARINEMITSGERVEKAVQVARDFFSGGKKDDEGLLSGLVDGVGDLGSGILEAIIEGGKAVVDAILEGLGNANVNVTINDGQAEISASAGNASRSGAAAP